MILLTIISALIIDQLAGEIKKWHPLVGFGSLAGKVELIFRSPRTPSHENTVFKQRLQGVISLSLITLPFVFIGYFITSISELALTFNIIVLYFALGGKSLKQHAQNIYTPLVGR